MSRRPPTHRATGSRPGTSLRVRAYLAPLTLDSDASTTVELDLTYEQLFRFLHLPEGDTMTLHPDGARTHLIHWQRPGDSGAAPVAVATEVHRASPGRTAG